MPTIYQKYRPQKFADITGQEHIVKTISNEIKNNDIAHSYLFFGSRGIGKTTIARLFAKALNCENRKKGEFEPCNECSSCLEISKGRNIDVMEIDAASHTQVENVRENIIENVKFKPTKSKYKVFIIDEVHMLSNSAFNALLKTLEEPPAHAVFILATTEEHKLPATIISRCQRFNFKKIGFDDMMKCLKDISENEKIKIDQKILERVINKSDGCLRDAQSLLGQIFSLGLKKIKIEDAEMILPVSDAESLLDFIESILKKDAQKAVQTLNQAIEQGVNPDQLATDLLEVLRSMIVLKINPKALLNVDYGAKDINKIKKMSDETAIAELINKTEKLLKRKEEIKRSPIPQMPLEMYIAENCLNDESPVKKTETKTNTPSAPDKISAETAPNLSDETPPPATSYPSEEKENAPLLDEIPAISALEENKTEENTLSENKKTENFKTTLQDIKDRWGELGDKISAEIHMMGMIFKMCQPENLAADGCLNVAVPFSIHKDKLEEQKTRIAIEKIIQEFFSEKLTIACRVNPDLNPDKEEEELRDLANDFGGEIME